MGDEPGGRWWSASVAGVYKFWLVSPRSGVFTEGSMSR